MSLLASKLKLSKEKNLCGYNERKHWGSLCFIFVPHHSVSLDVFQKMPFHFCSTCLTIIFLLETLELPIEMFQWTLYFFHIFLRMEQISIKKRYLQSDSSLDSTDI